MYLAGYYGHSEIMSLLLDYGARPCDKCKASRAISARLRLIAKRSAGRRDGPAGAAEASGSGGPPSAASREERARAADEMAALLLSEEQQQPAEAKVRRLALLLCKAFVIVASALAPRLLK